MGGQGTSFGSQQAARNYNAGVTARAPQTPASPMGGQGPSFGSPASAATATRATASAIKGGSNPSGSSKTASAIAGAQIGRFPGQGVTARAPNGDMMAPNVRTDFNQTLRREAQDIGKPNDYLDNSLGKFNDWATKGFSRYGNVSPKAAQEMARTVVGEAAREGLLGQAAVAKVMENRLALGRAYPGQYGWLGGGNEMSMLGGFDANGYQRARTGAANEGYNQATPDSPQYARAAAAMADSLDPYGDLATQRPDVLDATHYYNPRDASPKWAREQEWKNTATRLGNHVFGNPERTVDRVAALREASMPGAAARTQAYVGANPPSQQGALQLASYDGAIPANVQGSYKAQAPAAAPEPGIYNGLKSLPGAISGLGRGFKTFNDTVSTPNPGFKKAAGLIGNANPLVSGAAKIAAGQLYGPRIKEAVGAGIQSLKDTFDPSNPSAQSATRVRQGLSLIHI
jgi:spore germination cell wall hydrolase CwlJ-like protein